MDIQTNNEFNKIRSQMNGFRSDVEKISARVSTAEAARENRSDTSSEKKPQGSVAILLGTIPLLAVVATVGIWLDTKIDAIRVAETSAGTRLTKAEGAIKALADGESDQTQKLVHDLLAAAAVAERPDVAIHATEAALSLTTTLKQSKRPASQDFFQGTFDDAGRLALRQAPELKAAAYAIQQQLAEYRSALVPTPSQEFWNFSPMPHAVVIFPNATIDGGAFDLTNVSGDAFVLGIGKTSQLPRPIIMKAVLKGGVQTLDGLDWQHVVFFRMRVSYRGGYLGLQDVRFIDCTFDLPKDKKGTSVAEYVALGRRDLSIEVTNS